MNELSSALRRRFNTVVLPLPATREEEINIVVQRTAEMGKLLGLPSDVRARHDIERVVVMFRELRSGATEDNTTALKPPSSTLSTAEAISVVVNGLALAAHFGDGAVRPADLAAGLVATVVKDPVHDRAALLQYLDAVLKERDGWADMYAACRELLD